MRSSKLPLTVASALFMISSVAFGQTAAKAPAAAGVSAKLIAQEKVLLDSVVKHDVKAFSALIAPGAGSVDEGGYMPVADFIKIFDQAKLGKKFLDAIGNELEGTSAMLDRAPAAAPKPAQVP